MAYSDDITTGAVIQADVQWQKSLRARVDRLEEAEANRLAMEIIITGYESLVDQVAKLEARIAELEKERGPTDPS